MFIVPLARTSPPVSDLVRYVDEILDRQAGRYEPRRALPLDVVEQEDGYTVTVDLPGVAREDVQVSAEGRRLTLKAESSVADGPPAGVRVLRRERAPVRFERSLVLPEELDQARSSARLEHGVLTLTLAKRRPAEATRITIN